MPMDIPPCQPEDTDETINTAVGGNNHEHHDETINMATKKSNNGHHADTPRVSIPPPPLAGSATRASLSWLPKLTLPGNTSNQGGRSTAIRASLSPKAQLDNLMRRWLHDADAFNNQLGDFISARARERRLRYRLVSHAVEDDLTPLREPFEDLYFQTEVYCMRHLPGYNLSRELSDVHDARKCDKQVGGPGLGTGKENLPSQPRTQDGERTEPTSAKEDMPGSGGGRSFANDVIPSGTATSRQDTRGSGASLDDEPHRPTSETLTPAQILALSASMEVCLHALARVRGRWWDPEGDAPQAEDIPSYGEPNTALRLWSYKLLELTPDRIPDAIAAFASEERRIMQVLSGASPLETGVDAEATPPDKPPRSKEMSGAIVDDRQINTGGSINHDVQDPASHQTESSRRAYKLHMNIRRRWLAARFRALRPLCELFSVGDYCLGELEDILAQIEAIPEAPTTEMSLLKHAVRGRIQKIEGARKDPLPN